MRRFLLLLPLLLLAACAADEPAEPSEDAAACQETPGITYRTDGTLTFLRADSTEVKQIAVEIVRSDSTIQRGLMDRRCLPPDWGMLFVFPDEAPRTFYMANTPRSLDILFVAADSTLLNVAEYTEPFSPEILPSEGLAQFVVETPAGFTDRYGLVPGDRVSWTTRAPVKPPRE